MLGCCRYSLNLLFGYGRRHASTAHKHSLLHSREAQRQLTMGWQLDQEHKEAPPIPILERLFDDKELYTKRGELVAPSSWSFATPRSPLAASPSEIKGIHALFMQSLFQGRTLLQQCKTRVEVPKVMTLLYFPPWHPLAQGRKSRPALAVVTMHGEQFNGNTPALRLKQHASQKSRNPLDYAVWRQRTARRLRRRLFESWQSTPGFCDGLYIGITRRVPTDEQAREAFAKLLSRVAKSTHKWADKQRDSVNLAAITKRLTSVNLPPVEHYVDRRDWDGQE